MSENKIFNNILLIDGSYMLIRALKQPSLANMETRSGVYSGGVYGFLSMFQSVFRQFPTHFPIVCWDQDHSARRLELMPNYKHHADKLCGNYVVKGEDPLFHEHLRDSRAAVMQFLETMRVPSVRIPGWEGDDLCYLVSKKCKSCIIVTDDKDYIQLCSPSVSIYRPMMREHLTFDTIAENYTYPQYEYYKAIIGDPSDNIPQCCEGVGEKKALVIAKAMADFVKETGCNPHDFDIIFNYLALAEELNEVWKQVRGLEKLIPSFINSKDKFVLNMKLMDFHYVEEPTGMNSLLESNIIPTIKKNANILEMYKIIGKYELANEIEPSHLISKAVGANTILLG